jgi:hypothetical protein
MAIALLVLPVLVVVHAEAAAAAPPSNDTLTGAIPTAIGFSEERDTTEATTDADDAQLDATCGAPATDASVWYSFTPAADTEVVVDVSQSSYTATVLVGVGTPGDLLTFACGPSTVGFSATAGTTYYVLAVDDQLDGAGNGGTLRISLGEPPPPTTVDIAVDPVATFDPRSGGATFTGSYTCDNGHAIEALGQVEQAVGSSTVAASFRFSEAGTCDGTTRTWSARAVPSDGGFVGGKATTLTLALTCGDVECATDVESRTVMVRGGAS